MLACGKILPIFQGYLVLPKKGVALTGIMRMLLGKFSKGTVECRFHKKDQLFQSTLLSRPNVASCSGLMNRVISSVCSFLRLAFPKMLARRENSRCADNWSFMGKLFLCSKEPHHMYENFTSFRLHGVSYRYLFTFHTQTQQSGGDTKKVYRFSCTIFWKLL